LSLVRLEIRGISYSQTQSGAYALVLKEVKGDRTLPIVIGAFEAQAIAIALEKEIKPPRPLIHDLFKNFSDRFSIKVKQVIIHKLVDGVFFSSLICEKDKIEQIIDSRTSDAVALATRFNAPIFTYENILEKAGIYLNPLKEDLDLDHAEDEEDKNLEEVNITELVDELENYINDDDLSTISLEELEEKLTTAVENEDYESAAKIREELDKRQSL
jgi:bifunctional DNase/RNase